MANTRRDVLAGVLSSMAINSKTPSKTSVVDLSEIIKAEILVNPHGGMIRLPVGIFFVDNPIKLPVGYSLCLEGACSAFVSHVGINIPACPSADLDFISKTFPGLTVLVCRCRELLSYSGRDDEYGKLRVCNNIVFVGLPGALSCFHLARCPDLQLTNCTFYGFESYALIIRGGVTTKFQNLAFLNCGWRKDAKGSLSDGSYESGASLIFCSSRNPNDFVTIDPAWRPTTLAIDNCFFWIHQETSASKSCYRGIHFVGVYGACLLNVGGYTGCYFSGSDLVIQTIHIESYHERGAFAERNLRGCLAFFKCRILINLAMLSIMVNKFDCESNIHSVQSDAKIIGWA